MLFQLDAGVGHGNNGRSVKMFKKGEDFSDTLLVRNTQVALDLLRDRAKLDRAELRICLVSWAEPFQGSGSTGRQPGVARSSQPRAGLEDTIPF